MRIRCVSKTTFGHELKLTPALICSLKALATVGLSSSAISDVWIAVVLCYYLAKNRTGFKAYIFFCLSRNIMLKLPFQNGQIS